MPKPIFLVELDKRYRNEDIDRFNAYCEENGINDDYHVVIATDMDKTRFQVFAVTKIKPIELNKLIKAKKRIKPSSKKLE